MSVLHDSENIHIYLKQNVYTQNTFLETSTLKREVTHVFVRMGDKRFLYFDREKDKKRNEIICTLNSILAPRKQRYLTVEDALKMRYRFVEEELLTTIGKENFVKYTHLTSSLVIYERYFDYVSPNGIITFEQLEAYNGFEHKGFMPFIQIHGNIQTIETFYSKNKNLCERGHDKLKYCY